jgi:eukaryotic-like serine/threonine-protein kinase
MVAGPELGPGRRVAGRYRIHDLIARGGMGSVWHATDETLDREVAIKCVRLENHADADRALARERMLREARIAAKLLHPNIVTVFDVVEHDDPWLILEYVPSRSLAGVITERALPPADVAAIGAQIAAALAVAHHAGVVHRDVKPDNILITQAPNPLAGSTGPLAKLTDFGISRAANTPALTTTGVLTGTPAYFAPETARGEGADAASDMYSLGATLYTATEGRPPFGASPDNLLALLGRIARGNAPRPQHAGELTDLLQQLLADDPATRPTAAEAQEAFRRIATATPAQIAHEHDETLVSADEPTGSMIAQRPDPPELPAPPRHAPRRRIVIAALVAAALVATGAVIATRQPTGPGTTSTATAAMPAPDRQIVIDHPRSADPCSLIDLTALSQHGSVEIDRANSKFSACRANIRDRANLTVDLLGPDEYEPPGGALQRLGPLVIARFEATTHSSGTRTRCERRVELSDGNTVLVSAESPAGAVVDDMCAIAETGVTAAVDALFARGIGMRVQLDVERPLARVDACSLIRPADLAIIPGLENATGRPEFGSWGCTWASGSGTRARLDFWRSTQLTEADVDTDFNGRRGTVFFRPGSHCYAHVTWGDIASDGRQWPVDVVRIYVYGSKPEAELCGYARTLANAAAANLPPSR